MISCDNDRGDVGSASGEGDTGGGGEGRAADAAVASGAAGSCDLAHRWYRELREIVDNEKVHDAEDVLRALGRFTMGQSPFHEKVKSLAL